MVESCSFRPVCVSVCTLVVMGLLGLLSNLLLLVAQSELVVQEGRLTGPGQCFLQQLDGSLSFTLQHGHRCV